MLGVAKAAETGDFSSIMWLDKMASAEVTTKYEKQMKRYEAIMCAATTWQRVGEGLAGIMSGTVDMKEEKAAVDSVLETVKTVLQCMPQMKMNCACAALCYIVLKRPNGFEGQLKTTVSWVRNTLGLRIDQLPRYLQQLVVDTQSGSAAVNAAASSGSTTAPSGSASASSAAGGSEAASGAAAAAAVKKRRFSEVAKKMVAKG